MYFDIPGLQIATLSQILKDFREKLGVSKQDFFENLRNDIFFYDTETEETISLNMISNSNLGKSYSGRTRTIELSLGLFLSLIKKQYKNINKVLQDIQKQKTEYEQEILRKSSRLLRNVRQDRRKLV